MQCVKKCPKYSMLTASGYAQNHQTYHKKLCHDNMYSYKKFNYLLNKSHQSLSFTLL